jgi:GTP cyclohydrolase II
MTRFLSSVTHAQFEGTTDSELVVFRGGEGLRDQIAIVIGAPDASTPVLVRLHSACLTGDLFGSLKALGNRRVRLLINNPEKIAALAEAGLDAVDAERLLGRKNTHNLRYLAAKRDRAGHLIELDRATS